MAKNKQHKKKNKKKHDNTSAATSTVYGQVATADKGKMSRKDFEKELRVLQTELCHLQQWVVQKGLRVMVIFEGRDAAGKGGVIKRISERVSPRVFRVVATPAPSDREKTQLYFQRYIANFPAAGEVILFDRSWYNRAGVEHVMGFCTHSEYERFLHTTPRLEATLVEEGIILIKYFFDVTQQVQEERFKARATDPMRHWKLSPMDIESSRRWWDYTKAYDHMLQATDTPEAPWFRVPADDKRRARLNCISHLLSQIDYEHLPYTPPEAGKPHKAKPGTPKVLNFRHEVPQIF
jgi:polyphosphate kinase 2